MPGLVDRTGMVILSGSSRCESSKFKMLHSENKVSLERGFRNWTRAVSTQMLVVDDNDEWLTVSCDLCRLIKNVKMDSESCTRG